MREIKFRLWIEDQNLMIDGDSLAFEEYEPLCQLLTQDGIMQYTGLKDKYGKEIYEGDICSVDGGENIYEIIFYMGGFMVAVLPRKIRIYHIGDSLFNNIEVIGNIHKNPELIK